MWVYESCGFVCFSPGSAEKREKGAGNEKIQIHRHISIAQNVR